MLTQELHYLRSIYENLRALRSLADGPSVAGEALSDNIDWLDCFIEKHARDEEMVGSATEKVRDALGVMREVTELRAAHDAALRRNKFLEGELERLKAERNLVLAYSEVEQLRATIIGFTGKFVTREMVRDALKAKP